MNKVFNYNDNRKGFTLIELLATIAVLSIIISIVIYFSLNAINRSKEKSYETTINNVQNIANTYVMEDGNGITWVNDITDSYQYQCITVQKMIDKGYFKNDILNSYVNKNQKLKVTDYIYVERNIESKVITKSVLLVNEYSSYISGRCGNVSDIGNINFIVKPSGWSKEKEITIKYTINNSMGNVSSYKYDYVYNDVNLSKNFSSLSMKEKLTIDNNGTLNATIRDKNNIIIVSNSLVIDKIDNELPVVSIHSTNNVSDYQTVTLNMTDNAGISKYYFGQDDPNDTTVNWNIVSENVSLVKEVKVDNSGIWYLGVKDIVGNTKIVSKEFYKTILSVSNATVNPSTILTMEGNTFTLPNVTLEPYYNFVGWYNSDSFDGSKITTYNPISDITLYGKTQKNQLTGGSVKIIGVNAYGNTLTAQVTDTSPVADKYEYQWYYNSNNSVNGGTPITGANSKTYILNSETYQKYVYVVVTAKKNNYETMSFSDITDENENGTSKVTTRKITITAGSSSKLYDGNALTNNICTVTSGTLVFEQEITSCTMTGASTITNVGSVDNVIESVTFSSNKEYYDITYEPGILTVNRVNAVCPTITSYEGIYDGLQHSLTVTGGSGGTIMYKVGDRDWSNSLGSSSVVSDWTIYVKVVGDNNHNDVDCGSGRIIITPKQLTITAKDQTISFGNSIEKGINQVVADGFVSGDSLTDIILNQSTQNVTTNGTIIPSNATLINKDGASRNNCYNITYKTGSLKINKADCVCEISSYSTGLKYPGNKNGEIKYNCSGDGEIYVTSGNTSVITIGSAGAASSTLTAVGIGSSTITVGRKAGTNYNACSVTQPVSVAASTYTIKYNNNGGSGTIANQTATYGNSLAISNGSGFSKTGYNFTGWNSRADGSGTKYVAGNSYQFTGDTILYAQWEDAIVPATCPTITSYTGTYDGKQHGLTLTGGSGGTIMYRKNTTDEWTSTKQTASVAGTTTVYVMVKGDNTHTDVDCGSGTITINKKALTITANAQTINYGSSIATGTGQVTVSGLVNGDTVSSVDLVASTSSVTTSGNITPSAAVIKNTAGSARTGSYNITYKTGTLTINKVNAVCPTVTDYSGTYDAGSHTVTVSGGSGGTIKYRTSSTGTWGTTKPTRTSAGTTTVYVQVAGDSNHNTVDCGNKKITISQKAVTITAKAQTINYGSSIPTGTGQVTTSGLLSGHTLASVTLAASTTSVTTSGTITPSAATINDSSSTAVTNNYNITYNTGTLTINKVNATCPTVTDYSGTYDASSHTVTVSGGNGGTIQYRTSSTGTWGTTKPTRTSAGTTTVYVQVAGDSNHNTVDCGNKTIAISQKAVTITAKAQSIECKGSIATGVAQATASGLLSGHTLSSVTLTGSGNTVTSSGTIIPSAATINNSSSTAVTSNYSITYANGKLTVSDTKKPSVSVSRTDYNTFKASGSDSCSAVSYYFSAVNTSTAPTTSSTWVSTTSKDISGPGTYYVWAKDASGNISDVKSITAYTVTRSQGAGSTLTTRYDSTSSSTGTAFTSNTAVLSGTNVWASASANTGYGSPVLKRGASAVTNSSYAAVSAAVTIASSATRTPPTVSMTGKVNLNAITANVTASGNNGATISKIYYLLTTSTASCNTLSGYKDAGTANSYTFNELSNGDYYVCIKVEDNVDTTNPSYAKSSKLTINLTPLGTYLTNNKFNGATMYASYYRYSGTNDTVTDNYICFGTSDKSTCTGTPSTYMYRIIGVDSSGQVKIIKKEPMPERLRWDWDSSNNGMNSNDDNWSKSEMRKAMNASTYLSNTTYVPTKWADKLVTHDWKYGDTKKVAYEGSSYTSTYVNKETNWTTTVSAKVGLMYIHDWLYAYVLTTDKISQTNRTKSWIHMSNNYTPPVDNEWFISRYGSYATPSDGTRYCAVTMGKNGYMGFAYLVNLTYRPVVILNASVVRLSGTGTLTDPYIVN